MKYTKNEMEKIKELIKSGGVIVIPTDTVYGMACDALNEKAVRRIYDLKKRDLGKPMNILVSNIDMIKKITFPLSNIETQIINNFMPGALTIILKKNDVIPDVVTSGLDTIRC